MGCRVSEKLKMNYKKGLWSPDEDQKLRDYVVKHGLSCWSAVPVKAGLQRNGKSCRLRWINYLRPGLKRGNFSREEEETVMNLQAKLGNKWSQISLHLPGRTDNEVKNYWNSYLKKRVTKAQKSDTHGSATSSSDSTNQRLVKYEEPNYDQMTSIAQHVDPLELCEVDLSQSNTCYTVDFSPKLTALNNFPKVLFGDWISLDHTNGDSLFNLDEAISHPWYNTNSSAEVYGPELKEVEQASDGIDINGYGGACMYGEIQAQPEAMGQIPENGLFDILFPGVIYDKMESETVSFN